MAAFDREALPRTAAYVASLPGGLDAYPTARVRTAVTREITAQFPHLLEHAGIDREGQLRLRQAIDQGEWMLETEGVAMRLLVRDIAFATDADYHRWYFDIASKLFAKPLYRALMYVVSPTLVLLGASKRWATFREGSTLTARVDRKEGVVELQFPDGLYPELTLIGFGEAFRASLAAARARNLRVDLVEVTPVSARWALAWQ